MTQNQTENFVSQVLAYTKGCGAWGESNLPETPLRHLEYYLARHFGPAAKLRTLETGCGETTIVFSRYSHSHTVFSTVSDYQKRCDIIKAFPYRNSDVIFNNKPVWTQKFDDPTFFDVILLNDTKAYPVVEWEFLSIISHLKPGGILLVSGLEVPTVFAMYQFLEKDAMFFSHGIALQTGILVRTDAPVFDYAHGLWSHQSANIQNYQTPDWQRYRVDLPHPMSVKYDGWLNKLPSEFGRGFTLLGGCPASDGGYSEIQLRFQDPLEGDVRLTLELDVIAGAERAEAGCTIAIDQGPSVHVRFDVQTTHRIELVFPGDGRHQVTARITHHDARSASSLASIAPDSMLPTRFPNFVVRSIGCAALAIEPRQDAVKSALEGSLRRKEGEIASFLCRGVEVQFFVNDPHDSIQAHHHVGEFYERDELELLSRYIPQNAEILDVGANIGNHTVWFEKLLGAKRIVPVEPQVRMIDVFKTNCLLNGLRAVDQSCLGIALGEADGTGTIVIEQAFNPAGGRVEAGAGEGFPIRVGDVVLAGQHFDFIKIDVEGAEIGVLKGLKSLIARCKPLLFVEVWEGNRAAFDELMIAYGYELVDDLRRYDVANNMLMRPIKRA